jgi:Dolichyl-phosphate-mannose-protein mannosyltransferase
VTDATVGSKRRPVRGWVAPQWTIAVVLLLALLLRLWDLDARWLWFDEAGEYWVATAPFSQLAAAVRDGSGDPPLYSFLLHAWMQAGRSEAWLRGLSVLLSLAGVAGAFALGRRLGSLRVGVAAGLLVAFGTADIRYAQEVGQYALMVAALYWSLFALARAVERPDRSSWAAWVVAALVASHAYYGAALAVMVPFACVLVEGAWKRTVRTRGAWIALCVYALGMLPLLYFVSAQLTRVTAAGQPGASSAPSGLLALVGWIQQPFSFPFTGWPYSPVPAWVSTPLVLVMLAWGMRSQRRLAVWFAATWLVTIATDRAGIFPYGFRWGLITSPLLVALLAAGLAGGGRAGRLDRARPVVFAAILIASIVSLPARSVRDRFFDRHPWAWPETEDVGAIADTWLAHRTPQQPTYVYYGAAPAFAYYVSRAVPSLAERPPTWHLTCWHDGSPSYCHANGVHFGRWLRGLNQQQQVASVFRTLEGQPREFWLVFGHLQPGDDTELLSSLVMSGYQIVSAAQARDTGLFLLRRS